jgi:hypothetical protein
VVTAKLNASWISFHGEVRGGVHQQTIWMTNRM